MKKRFDYALPYNENGSCMKTYPATDKLRRAVIIREQMDKLTAELDDLLSSEDDGTGPRPAVETRAKMSAETKAKIAAKQAENWAKRRKLLEAAGAPTPGKKRSKAHA